MSFMLRIEQGLNAGAVKQIPDGAPAVIGRQPGSWLEIDEADRLVSGKHAEIRWQGDQCILTHTGRNPTVVTSTTNGPTTLAEKGETIVLSDGDRIRMSKTELYVLYDADEEKTYWPPSAPPVAEEEPPPPATTAILTIKLQDGSEVVVPPDSEFVIGRSSECDLKIKDDPSVSRKHCRISANAGEFRLHNLSSHGTFVEGELVADGDVVLNNGDQVVLTPNTQFEVFTGPRTSVPNPTLEMEVAPPVPVPDAISAKVGMCPSGLQRYDSLSSEQSAAGVARKLAASRNIYAIFDFPKAGMEIPADLQSPAFLFSWLSSDMAAIQSPVIVTPGETERFFQLLDEAWGKDAVVCFFSAVPTDEMIAHFRMSTGYSPDEGGGLLGYFWPRILHTMLVSSASPEVVALLANVDAVLLESDHAESGWTIFSNENNPFLDEAGIRGVADENPLD